MTDHARTYGDLTQIIEDYFQDLAVRQEAVKSFCLAMLLENALQLQEIDLLKAELAEKFKLD